MNFNIYSLDHLENHYKEKDINEVTSKSDRMQYELSIGKCKQKAFAIIVAAIKNIKILKERRKQSENIQKM